MFLCLMLLHAVINSVRVHTLPTAQVPSALTDSFSWGHDPFPHACKARSLTVVGWTSLSGIVIAIPVCVLCAKRVTVWTCESSFEPSLLVSV